MAKLTKEQAEKKAKFHETKAKYYNKKVAEIKKESRIIGFKFY